MDSNEEPKEKEFIARPFQTILYERAKQQNTIVCLGTGTGKTYIAIMLMKDPMFSRQLKGDFMNGETKRTVFLVPTRPLVEQQVLQIKRHFEVRVKGFTGDVKVDNFKAMEWTQELCANEVIVMTPEILLKAFDHSFISMERLNLLIIDEVHWAAKTKGNKESGHTYKQIMNRYKELERNGKPRPRVLGLSACLINSTISLNNFEDAIKDLEQTYCAVCVTAPQICGTHPKEDIYSYMSRTLPLSPNAQTVMTSLVTFIEYLKELKESLKEKKDSIPSCISRIKNCLTNIKNMFSGPLDTMGTDRSTLSCMGVWCTAGAINEYIKEMIPYRDLYANVNPIQSELMDIVIRYLYAIKKQFEPELEENPMAALSTASPKMHELRQLLLKYKPISGQKSKLCGIVFVKQRTVAKVLAEWLKKLRKLLPVYEFLNVEWVVGHSSQPGFDSLINKVSEVKQKEIIKKFYTQELNLLVATSVLEEGIDVPKCNLVVRYDRIHSFRQYLQSKGRARAEEALYCMLAPNEECNELKAQLENFKKIEEFIENLNNRQKSNVQSLEDNPKGDYFGEEEHCVSGDGSARVTSRRAIALLYRYCANLPSDSFTKLVPKFDLENNELRNGFRYSVQLPINSPLKSIIFGKINSSKKWAKMSAAFETCKQLKDLEELDHRFLPISKVQFTDKYVQQLGLKIYESVSDKQKAGTRNRTDNYRKRWAQVFTGSSFNTRNEYSLHKIYIKFPKMDCFDGKYRTFGAITCKPIANNYSFPVFVNIRQQTDGSRETTKDCSINFILLNTIKLTENERTGIESFHKYTFSDVLRLEHINNNVVFKPLESEFDLLVVPLMDESIDWHFIEMINNCGHIEVKELSKEERQGFTFNAQTYRDCVFYPSYRSDTNNPVFYDCIKITDLTPKSKWTDTKYMSYEHYFRCNYKGLEVYNKDFPLIEGRVVKNCAQLKREILKKVDLNKREYFIPELISVHPFPSSLWRQALCLPTILYRLNQLVLCTELSETIHLETMGRIESQNKSLIELKNELMINSNINESIIGSPKRSHIIEDSEDCCDGHPFVNEMDETEEWYMCSPKKKLRNEYKITVNEVSKTVPLVNSMLSNDSITGLQSNDAFLRLTDAVINKFKELIEQLRTGDKEINVENLDISPTIDCQNISDYNLSYGQSFPFIFSGDIEPYIRGNYDSSVGDVIPGPTPDLLLNALTLREARDAFNLERLETIGDSFLKFVTTCFLYYSCPQLDEGRLTYLRSIQICNCNLYYIGLEKHINELLVSKQWVAKQNWLPPSYDITDDKDMALLNDETRSTGAFKHHRVNDKSIADSIEALIGAHLMIGSNKSALIFMEWLGLKVTPNGHKIDYTNEERREESELFRWLPAPNDPIICSTGLSAQELQEFFDNDYNACGLDHLEDTIGYKFQNKAFLIQALTHSTYYSNRYTDCYQRLEFLGDSVLDYVITRHIYDKYQEYSPGQLTDLRSALVNNSFFASIAVKYNYHKYLKLLSPELFRTIEAYVKKFEENKVLAINQSIHALTEEECCDLEEIEVPKALGDIFESIAGAIFLDTGLSLDRLWKVYYRLLKPEIDYFGDNVPKMPVRELREMCEKIKFSDSKQISGRKIRITVEVNGTEYAGIGRNRKLAKIAASKNALRSLKKTNK